MQQHLVPLGPLNIGTRINDPDNPIVAGFSGDRVVLALDVPMARRLAAILGLLQAGGRPDLTVLDLPPAERAEWMKALVDILAAASTSAPARVLPVSWGPRILSEVGHQETGEVRIDVSHAGLPTIPTVPGTSFKEWPTPHLQAVDWSPSIEDAGELDDTVIGGYLCSCGWAAIDKGPTVTPTFDDDVTHHTQTCQHVDDELGAPAGGQRLTVVKAYDAPAVAR